MLSKTRGIQRRMNELGLNVNLLEGPRFKKSNKGLLAASNNRFAHQQANGGGIQSHNMITIRDTEEYSILSFGMWEMRRHFVNDSFFRLD